MLFHNMLNLTSKASIKTIRIESFWYEWRKAVLCHFLSVFNATKRTQVSNKKPIRKRKIVYYKNHYGTGQLLLTVVKRDIASSMISGNKILINIMLVSLPNDLRIDV